MKDLIIDDAAEAELVDALARHTREWAGTGRDLHAEFQAAFDEIRRHPKRFAPYGRDDYRVCILPRAPYAVYFLELPAAVWIAAISHTSRRPGYWRRRRPPRR